MAKKWGPLKKGLFHDFGLTILLGSLFLVSWIGQAYFQWVEEADIAQMHNEVLTWSSYFPSFASATLENWQSEFLQLFTFIVFTTFLIHRGSPESRDGDDEMSASLLRIEKRLEKLVPGELANVEKQELEELKQDVESTRKLHRKLQED